MIYVFRARHVIQFSFQDHACPKAKRPCISLSSNMLYRIEKEAEKPEIEIEREEERERGREKGKRKRTARFVAA